MEVIIAERLGNLHLVLLHLPIGFVVAAVLLEFWRWRRPSAEGAWLQGRLLAANAVGALLTAAAGLLLASAGGYPEDALAWHRWAGVACAGLAVVAWMVHGRGGAWMGRVALGLLLGATMVAGHHGATLTHGAGVTVWWGRAQEPAIAATGSDPVFIAEIQPMLARTCIECHGPDKARGRLRLDIRAAALAGGKSEIPAIMPGKPDASELIRRVKLPRDHEEAMPADDGPGLTIAEIAALERWIATGARW